MAYKDAEPDLFYHDDNVVSILFGVANRPSSRDI